VAEPAWRDLLCFEIPAWFNGYHHPAMLNDAARAVRWVRAHAADYKVDVKRVGIMGSSAGGHLASTLLTHFDAGDKNSTDAIERQSSRPDLEFCATR